MCGGKFKFSLVIGNLLPRLPTFLCCPLIPLQAPPGSLGVGHLYFGKVKEQQNGGVRLWLTSVPIFPAAEEDAPRVFCMGCAGVWGDSIMRER